MVKNLIELVLYLKHIFEFPTVFLGDRKSLKKKKV